MIRASTEDPRARTVWVLADQVLSSLGNFALGTAVARKVTPDEYGAFAVTFTAYAVALGVSRAFATDPLIVRFSAHAGEDQTSPARSALGTATGIGALAGLALVLVGGAIGGAMGTSMLVMGFCLPVLLVQDAYRYVAIAARRPRAAVANDLVWLGAFLGILAAAAGWAGWTTAGPYLIAWSGAAAVGSLVAWRLATVGPSPGRWRMWFADHRDLSLRFAGEFLMMNGAPQIVLLAIVGFAGLSAGGAMRGASVLMSPAVMISVGLVTAAIPEGVRAKDRSPAALRRGIGLLTVALGVGVSAWGVLISLSPDALGEQLLGATWSEAKEVVLPLAFAAGGSAASLGLMAGLRSVAAARRSLRATAPSAVLVVAGGVSGAIVSGATGAAVGMIVPAWIGVTLYLVQFKRAMDSSLNPGRQQ